MQYGRLSS